ncbi:SMP-30/gluconolactonase/LRE family protein [Actinophytocola oryzae]|uniref:Sugar lactone lactonase YvrE n=1 Tax=Actinophytocola oryzae TaxID=502181 RepID=A0A4R7VXT4_9PSEU|nr:SMP-30/gluconolactonase/LRE family protein [Actinophytocola oryzae]TDV54864.1 sugar lactone lactonase YvrE [Actinophytocola oryzae]
MERYTAEPALETRAEHAEGPAWDARRDELLWVDQFAGLVHRGRWHDGLEVVRTYELGMPVGAVVPTGDPDGGWLCAAGRGFARLDLDGTVTVLAEREHDGNRMNDGKCDPHGRFWAGSMAWSKEDGAGSLYRMDGDGSVTTVLRDVTISNGMAWTRDRMYYIDTPTQRVDVFDFAPDGGISDRRAAFAVGGGAPDGMCVDDEGCLWVALWGGSGVRRYSPAGETLAFVDVAAPQVSSCAFAGDRLFVTTSREGYDEEDSARYPHAGKVFTVRLPVGGPPARPAA